MLTKRRDLQKSDAGEHLRTACASLGGQVVAGSNPVNPTRITAGQAHIGGRPGVESHTRQG
jgi:hypothetical protein